MRLAGGLLILLMFSGVASADVIWWEGESPFETNFPAKTWLSASSFEATRGAILSGGDWLTCDGKRAGAELFAKYRVNVPADGSYSLYARKFWKHGPFRWRFDDGDWQTCGADCGLIDSTPIRQFVCVNWVHLGKVQLKKGSRVFELRLLAKEGESTTAAFDCFVLTTGAFLPRGKLKPGEKSGAAEAGWWAFEPPPDEFRKAELDLRSLNEKSAGESGFVARKDGHFVLGSGSPVRFWGVNVGPGVVQLSSEHHDYLARRLAKVGVNIVRIHSGLFKADAADPAAVDAAYLDKLHHFVASLKKEGIYAELSFYFPVWFDVKPGYGIPGYDGAEKKPFALLYFDPRMQEIYKSWARGLLTTKNPYTGVALAKDPAVALVEIINEDSFLFWTFNEKAVPPVQMAKLEKRFGDWLKARYGAIDKALAAWGNNAKRKEDVPAEGRVALLAVWHLTRDGVGKAAPKARLSDELRFLVEEQRGFYASMAKHFRADLGVKSLIVASNWTTADAATLDALERWTYCACDVMDRHGYFGGKHEGPHAGWAVEAGDTFADRAGVLEPGALPLQFIRTAGFPQIISEIGWTNPNRFKAEFAPLAAAYGSLQGVDAIFFFAVGSPDWDSSIAKFPVGVPSILGEFPATALAYRRGDFAEGPEVFREDLGLDDLYDFKGSGAVSAQALDDLRKGDVPAGTQKGTGVSAIDSLAFYVGKVVRVFHDRGPSTYDRRDLSREIDRKAKVVRSATGELTWDYGRGVVTLNSPRTQGVVGFLSKAGRVELKDVIIESGNEFGAVLVTSLNDKPLAQSQRLLVQAMTEEKHFGWKVEGGKIASVGGFPVLVRNVDATVTLKEGARYVVETLDGHGCPRGQIRAKQVGRGLEIRLPADALYVVVTLGE